MGVGIEIGPFQGLEGRRSKYVRSLFPSELPFFWTSTQQLTPYSLVVRFSSAAGIWQSGYYAGDALHYARPVRSLITGIHSVCCSYYGM